MSISLKQHTSKQKGFTLIELVMIIVVLSAVSTGLISVLGKMTGGVVLQNDAQISLQLAQECSEYLVGLRRKVGYNMNSVVNCTSLPLFAGNLVRPSVTLSDASAESACPSLATCKRFDITATFASAQAQTSIMMISY